MLTRQLVQEPKLVVYGGIIFAGIISFVLKISWVDWHQIVYLDAYYYLAFANNLIHGEQLPNLGNIGFSLFLYPFFKLVGSNDYLILSGIQRIITITLSCVTFPILYSFLKRFLGWKYGLLGIGLFAIEPHLFYNSILGVTEPLYIFLGVCSLYTITGSKYNWLAFVLAGFATITRFEGVTILLVISLIYLSRSGITKPTLYKLGSLGIIAGVIISAFVGVNLIYGTHQVMIKDKLDHEIHVLKSVMVKPSLVKILSNSVLYMGWSTYPVFIWFIPLGIYGMIKTRTKPRLYLFILFLFVLPGLVAYLRAFDTRYFITAFPFITLVSLYGIQIIQKRYGRIILQYKIPILISITYGLAIFGSIETYQYEMTQPSFDTSTIPILNNAVVIYPTYTLSAYDDHGFYSYYKGYCGIACLDIPDKFNSLKVSSGIYGYNTAKKLYPLITDSQVDTNPDILKQYSTVILLHNEYVTQNEFDAITNHPHVIYLYPNALYGKVQRQEDGTILLINGHGYPQSNISNGFDWKDDNSRLEYTKCTNDFKFYKISNGYMLNCTPENIINKDANLWIQLSKLKS